MASYWETTLKRRVGRRRALIAGGLAATAAFLAACGGDDDDGGTTGAPGTGAGDTGGTGGAAGTGGGGGAGSGVFHQPVDTTDSAVRGGTWRASMNSDPENFDLFNFDATLQPFSNVVGSQLLKMAPSRNTAGLAGHELDVTLAVEGDLAESWEFSGDGLTLTIKLHPEAKWSPLSTSFHAGAPQSIGGRKIDADDVLFSWERFITTSTAAGRLELAAAASPSGAVESLTKIDDSTIQMKLVRPSSALQAALATWNVGYFYILPKEGRDDAQTFFERYQFGAGPYYIDSYEPSVRVTLKRNPNFELRDTQFKRPFADQVDLPIVPDASSREAQLRGGNLFNAALGSTENTLLAKQDIPELLLLTSYANQGEALEFGLGEGSPWIDVRVRRAVSMAWNREEFIVASMSIDRLEQFGIPPNIRWAAGLSGNEQGFPNGTYQGYWLDPQGSDFGEEATVFQFQPDEARALLDAAGFSDGITADHLMGFVFPTSELSMEILNGTLAEIGINLANKRLDPAEVNGLTMNEYPGPGGGERNWGNWNGIFTVIDSGGPDPASYIHQMYHKNGGRFRGYNPDSRNASVEGDPVINEIVEKMFLSFDEDERISLAHDFQRRHAQMAYRFRYPGCATSVAVWWPAVQNLGVWTGESSKRVWTNEWIDATKPPLSG